MYRLLGAPKLSKLESLSHTFSPKHCTHALLWCWYRFGHRGILMVRVPVLVPVSLTQVCVTNITNGEVRERDATGSRKRFSIFSIFIQKTNATPSGHTHDKKSQALQAARPPPHDAP